MTTVTMTEKEKEDLAVERLTEGHLDFYGGYPLPGRWFDDVFVYSDGGDCGNSNKNADIVAHRRADLIAWVDRALAWVADGEPEFDDPMACIWSALLDVDAPADCEPQLSTVPS